MRSPIDFHEVLCYTEDYRIKEHNSHNDAYRTQ